VLLRSNTHPPVCGWRPLSKSSLVQRVTELFPIAPEQYYRLILVVESAGAGKTEALRELSGRHGFPYINVNLELSQRLLHLNARQRSLRVAPELEALAVQKPGTVLLDNLEMLFDPALQIDPLSGLQRMSRNTTIVATWNGTIINSQLRYADPGHPEYRRYPVVDFLLAHAEPSVGLAQ